MSKLSRLVGAAVGLLVSSGLAANAETIAVVIKAPISGNQFWGAVEAGAKAKAKELGVDVNVLAPTSDTDIQGQINLVEDLLTKKIDAIAIAPSDPNAVGPVIEEAKRQGVGLVFIDTKGINEGVTYIGTDNEAGAALAADYICKTVPKGSKVAIMQGIMTQSTGKARAEGSHKGFEACGLNIVAEQPTDWDPAKAQAAMENIITGHPDIAAVFASNDNMALGVVQTLKSYNMLDKVTVVGFDANPDAAESILAGEMSATVAQNPHRMGELGVEYALKVKKGEPVEPVVDTGTVLVTKDNAKDYQ